MAEVIVKLGRGSLLAKVDCESAYWLMLVYPQDWLLPGVRWNNKIYIDLKLPFGLRSAPKIFNAVTHALVGACTTKAFCASNTTWMISLWLDQLLQCQEILDIFHEVCRELGMTTAEHKTEGPTPSFTFLVIEIDTLASQLRLPEDKLHRLQSML